MMGGTEMRICALLIAATVACILADAAQNAARAPFAAPVRVQSAPDPPGTIDGAKNPELIPDLDAYRLFFMAIAEPSGATTRQLARLRGKLACLNLSDRDFNTVVAILAEFDTNKKILNSRL